MPVVEISIKGLGAVSYVISQIPEMLPIEAILPTMLRIRDIGVEAMKTYIMRSTGEKATGALVSSIEGTVDQISPEEWRIEVGTNIDGSRTRVHPYPWLYHQGVGATTINRPVYREEGWPQKRINPGTKWVWIGLRPPIPAKPFTHHTANIVLSELAKVFDSNLAEVVKEVDRGQKVRSEEP